jgi:lipopolysaccharide transport system permease protein
MITDDHQLPARESSQAPRTPQPRAHDLPWAENAAPAGWFPKLPAREIWGYRELAIVLARRDLKVRYTQTALGIAWVVIQPLAAGVIFTVIFGRLADVPSDGLPYAVFVYSGLVLWGYFSGALDSVAQSLVQNRDLVTKTYFPALVAPVALALPGLVDLCVSLLVVGAVMAAYGVAPGPAIVLTPIWIAWCYLAVLAAGLFLSALNVRYRDVRHTMTFLIQIWLFASPVVYASSLVEGAWAYLYAMNPMVGVLDGFRWSLVDGPPPGPETFVSLAVTAFGLAGGLLYFLRAERRFADLI